MARRLLIATRKGLFTAARDKQGWSIRGAALLGDPVTMVLTDASGAIHAAQELGHFGVKVKRSTDTGKTWEDRPAPAYPPKPDDVVDLEPIGQTPIPWDVKTIWSLETGHRDRPDEIWCGTIPGGLFKSDNGGDSWQLVESLWHHEDRKLWVGGGADLPGIHSILIDPRDRDTVRIGVSCGGLWISDDAGKSWDCYGQGMRAEFMPPEEAYNRKVQDPHCIVQCRASPDHLWIQHHNGIFRSTDGGRTCEEIVCESPSSFGFATVVHPDDPDTAWFIPGVKDDARYPVDGRLVVTRTRDGGRSFETLARGLPTEHSYDLVYRHAFDIDATGHILAFGSTTGNLWLSESQGDDWELISSFLPPIYCVRFAD